MNEHDREALDAIKRIYAGPSPGEVVQHQAERAAEVRRRVQELSGLIGMGMTPSEAREMQQAQRFIEATKASLDDAGRDSC